MRGTAGASPASRPLSPDSPDAVAAILRVSRETTAKLDAYVALLRKWQRSQNLVAPATLDHVWTRHVADSAQALAALPDARRWVDLGSGAGFPGLVTALLLAEDPGARVTLVESNRGKAAFLRTVIRETDAPAEVIDARIEAVGAGWTEAVDAVSARALAPLPALLGLAAPFLARGGVGVFHKGEEFAAERDAAAPIWECDLLEIPSAIRSGSRIVLARNLRGRSP